MENKEQVKNAIKKTAEDMIHSVKILKVIVDMEHPEGGDLLIDALMEELEKLRKKPEPKPCDTCCSEGPGVAKEPEKAVLYMDFGSAIKAVKQGKSVARKGWNGKNQFVELATCISYKGNAGEIVNCHHNNIGNNALAFIGTSGVQMGWLASQADMLAEDWYIVE